MDENDQVTRRRAEEIVSEAMELAIARMVMEAEAGRNRDEIGQALEAIRVREGGRNIQNFTELCSDFEIVFFSLVFFWGKEIRT